MGRQIEVPGVGAFAVASYGLLVSEPFAIAALGGRKFRFGLDGYEDDPHPKDFIQAMQNILAAGPRLLADATPYVHQYCLDMQELWADEAPELGISNAMDVWRHVEWGTELVLSRDHGQGRDVFISAECNCAWEVEHGLELVFKNGLEVSKVGPFDGHVSNESAYADESLRGVIYKRIAD